jgi:hypothetical protein
LNTPGPLQDKVTSSESAPAAKAVAAAQQV